jgi:uncharacterized LabA/DUF88 family protein
MSTLVLIDGPNIFNDVDRWFAGSSAPHDSIRREYFRDWFDLDRLVYAAIEQGGVEDFRNTGLGAVIFHSAKAVGRSSVRLSGEDADRFWGRQASVPGMSTVLVTVPGEQPERSQGTCSKCGDAVVVTSTVEKGVDTSMVTYLYEAVDQWEQAVLVTNDADFVPPVQALRRRGKSVFVVAVDAEGAGALKRACQTFFPVPPSLRPGGALDRALDLVEKRNGKPSLENIHISADGRTPFVELPVADGNVENIFSGEIREYGAIVWSPIHTRRGGLNRVGHILDEPRATNFGVAAERHLDAFKGARWLERWYPQS